MNISYDYPPLDMALNALAHKKRRAILHDLSLHPNTISKLATRHDLSLPAIHKHIRVLENANLIARRKAGRINFLALKQDSLAMVQAWLMQYRVEWGNSEATLANYIAEMRE